MVLSTAPRYLLATLIIIANIFIFPMPSSQEARCLATSLKGRGQPTPLGTQETMGFL